MIQNSRRVGTGQTEMGRTCKEEEQAVNLSTLTLGLAYRRPEGDAEDAVAVVTPEGSSQKWKRKMM